jgi:hypothetical protein
VRRLCGVLGGYTWLRQTVRLTCSVPLAKSMSSNLKAKHSPLPQAARRRQHVGRFQAVATRRV